MVHCLRKWKFTRKIKKSQKPKNWYFLFLRPESRLTRLQIRVNIDETRSPRKSVGLGWFGVFQANILHLQSANYIPKIKMHLIGKGVEEKGWDGYIDLIKRGFILPLGIKMFLKLITDCYMLTGVIKKGKYDQAGNMTLQVMSFSHTWIHPVLNAVTQNIAKHRKIKELPVCRQEVPLVRGKTQFFMPELRTFYLKLHFPW